MMPEARTPNGTSNVIKARVRPGHKFGNAAAGEIVEVTPRDLANASHALVTLDAEEAERTAKANPTPKADPAFDSMRASALASGAALKASIAQREAEKYGPIMRAAVGEAIKALEESLDKRIEDAVRRALAGSRK